jgi:hypothetical protein
MAPPRKPWRFTGFDRKASAFMVLHIAPKADSPPPMAFEAGIDLRGKGICVKRSTASSWFGRGCDRKGQPEFLRDYCLRKKRTSQ